jgi:NodT family efflux transporter outer membrane factor (OMF) lipoprotein
MTRPKPLVLLTVLTVCASTYVLGCTGPAQTVDPPVEVPEAFAEAGANDVPDRWWTAFDDERLNTMVDRSLTSNLTLRTGWQRLQAAQAVVDRESAALLPDLDGSAQGTVNRTSGGEVRETDALDVGLSTVYEVDLWGRIRSRVEAEAFRAAATRADYQTAALSIAAEVVRTTYRLAEAQNQLALVEQQIETNITVLNLLENRFGTGQIRSVDILRQQQLVEATREQRAFEESRIEVLEHQLAVLLGRPPQDSITAVPDSLPDLPPLPDTGIPTDLVRRRPDVQSAFGLVQAADRDLAAAISNQYPRLTLSASAGSAADNAGSLFEDWALAFAGNLLAPIFYGGALRAEVDRTEAVREQRLFEYGQTILVAFQEVEDALVQETKQRESIQHLEEQIELATQAYDQLRVQYLNGTTNYLDVLTALDEVQQLRRDLLAARLTLVEDRIALYRALAGSFETARESAGE